MNIPELSITMTFKDIRKDDFLGFCHQENIGIKEIIADKEMCYVSHWWVAPKLLVSLYTSYEPIKQN